MAFHAFLKRPPPLTSKTIKTCTLPHCELSFQKSMPSPCPKCGGTKVEPVDSRLFHWLADVFGYRLRMCGRCRGYRLFRARGPRSSQSSAVSQEPSPESMLDTSSAPAGNVAVAEASPGSDQVLDDHGKPAPNGHGQVCPSCGSHDCRRSHRTWWERRRNAPPMYRCRQCDCRFREL